MKKSIYCGLMSGSSLDGLDISIVKFYSSVDDPVRKYKLLYSNTISFPEELQERLRNAINLSVKDFLHLENVFSRWCGLVVKTLPPKIYKKINTICTHGHTILHQPELGLTYQLCNGWELARAAQKPVIYDFRRNDIVHGGQGAPLAPIVEKYLFPEDKIFLNLGGIANISIHTDKEIIAYDVCPFNQVLNELAKTVGKEYDDGGSTAKKGRFLPELVHILEHHNFFTLPPPKSLDNNWIKDEFLPQILDTGASAEDKLHTLTVWMASKIIQELEKYPALARENEIVLTGGGYWNSFFMEILSSKVKELELKGIKSLEKTMIDSKEAILVALLGHLYDRKTPNSLASVTGAEKNTINGIKIRYKN